MLFLMRPASNVSSKCPPEFEQLCEGVTLERRAILRLSLGALGALAIGWPFRAIARQGDAVDDVDQSWDRLIEQIVPMARLLVSSARPNEESYVQELSAIVTGLSGAPDVQFPPDEAVASVTCFDEFPVRVLQFKLEPGAVIPHHDHRNYNGVLCIIAGQVFVRSYEIATTLAKPLAMGSLLIRETRREQLGQGGASSLSRTKNNIHQLRAGPEGARLIDFFTLFDRDAKSVYLNVTENRRDLGPDVFQANWVGHPV
jgi:hypothetical protein